MIKTERESKGVSYYKTYKIIAEDFLVFKDSFIRKAIKKFSTYKIFKDGKLIFKTELDISGNTLKNIGKSRIDAIQKIIFITNIEYLNSGCVNYSAHLDR